MGHLLGSARVSTADQQPQLQVDAWSVQACYRVFTETASGARTGRPPSKDPDQLRPGDTLVVWKHDRLGRSLRHLVDTITGLADRGIGFGSLKEAIDTTTPAASSSSTFRHAGRVRTRPRPAAPAENGRAIRPATIQIALGELATAELVASASEDGQQRWRALPTARDPLLEAVDPHGAHDFRHSFATWLEDAGVPAESSMR